MFTYGYTFTNLSSLHNILVLYVRLQVLIFCTTANIYANEWPKYQLIIINVASKNFKIEMAYVLIYTLGCQWWF